MLTAPYCDGNVLQESCPSGKLEVTPEPPERPEPELELEEAGPQLEAAGDEEGLAKNWPPALELGAADDVHAGVELEGGAELEGGV